MHNVLCISGITFVQRRPNVFDVGPTLYKCYTNVLCLLGCFGSAPQQTQTLVLPEMLNVLCISGITFVQRCTNVIQMFCVCWNALGQQCQ